MKCDKLNTTANVIMSGCGRESNFYGDKCLFYCEHGYKPVSGTKERHCQENGTWSGSPLTCAGKLLRHCFSRTDFKMIDQDPGPDPDPDPHSHSHPDQDLGPFLESPGPVESFLVHTYLKTETSSLKGTSVHI